MAPWGRLAAAGNAVDEALSRELGTADARPLCRLERGQLCSARRVRADAADTDQPHRQASLPDRSAAARPAGGGTERSQTFCFDRQRRHQLDHRSERCRTRSDGAHCARGRARNSNRPAGTRIDPRLAQGVQPRARSCALKTVEALAQADTAGTAKGDTRQDRGICDRDFLDGESVPQRPSHLRRNHQPRSLDRRSRRHQCRIYSLSRLLQPYGGASHLSRRSPSLASFAAGHSDRGRPKRGSEAATAHVRTSRGDPWTSI